jgi:hypothetical protein
MAAIEYLTVSHLNTKDLIHLFSSITIHKDLHFNGSPCWIWCKGRTVTHGYGRVYYGLCRKSESAHRLMFAWLVHPLPRGKQLGELDHLCRRPSCCSPLHLEFVSGKENIYRGNGVAVINARKTHCKRDHPLSGSNLKIDSAGKRQCRICQKNYQRQYYKDNPERCRAYAMKYLDANRESVRQRDYANRDKINARHRARYHYLKSIGVKPH